MSQLAILQTTLTQTIREAIPNLASVEGEAIAGSSPALPALRHGIVSMVADAALGMAVRYWRLLSRPISPLTQPARMPGCKAANWQRN
jgi:hypothetical protein